MHQLTQRLALRQPAVLSEFHLAQAVPVVLNLSGIEQPIRAYLSANPPAAELMYKEVRAASAGLPASAMAGRFKRLFCFFELPTSLPVAVNASCLRSPKVPLECFTQCSHGASSKGRGRRLHAVLTGTGMKNGSVM